MTTDNTGNNKQPQTGQNQQPAANLQQQPQTNPLTGSQINRQQGQSGQQSSQSVQWQQSLGANRSANQVSQQGQLQEQAQQWQQSMQPNNGNLPDVGNPPNNGNLPGVGNPPNNGNPPGVGNPPNNGNPSGRGYQLNNGNPSGGGYPPNNGNPSGGGNPPNNGNPSGGGNPPNNGNPSGGGNPPNNGNPPGGGGNASNGANQQQAGHATQHQEAGEGTNQQSSETFLPMLLYSKLDYNIKTLKAGYGESTDVIFRKLTLEGRLPIDVAVVYIDGIVDDIQVHNVIESLYQHVSQREVGMLHTPLEVVDMMETLAVSVGSNIREKDFTALNKSLLSGRTIVLVEGYTEAISYSTTKWASRGVSEPISQTVIRGPQDAFNETLRTNTALLRHIIKNPNLWIETMQIGRQTQTDVAILYIQGVAPKDKIEEVRRRLNSIDIDSVLEGNYIEEFIQDASWTMFPLVNNTERPDKVAAALLEGRIAIIVDGTPYVLIVPALFIHFLQSPEDYYHSADFGFMRMLRLVGVFIALFAPSLYIAITTFHQEMIPTVLLYSIAAQREGVPFPAFIEALIMELTFEFLRESGTRMPRAVGTSISIVGALVLGQASVEAGLVSPAMVIIVAITALSSFLFPSYEMGMALRLLRFVFMGLAASFGLFGVFVGFLGLVLHLSHLQSFGVPYMSPLAPYDTQDQKDTILRFPWYKMITRPRYYRIPNQQRMAQNTYPWMLNPYEGSEQQKNPNPSQGSQGQQNNSGGGST